MTDMIDTLGRKEPGTTWTTGYTNPMAGLPSALKEKYMHPRLGDWLAIKTGKGILEVDCVLLLALYTQGQNVEFKVGTGVPPDATFVAFQYPGENGWNPGRSDKIRILFKSDTIYAGDTLMVVPKFTMEEE